MIIHHLWIGMRAEEAAALFDRLAAEARAANGKSDKFRFVVAAQSNRGSGRVRIVFNNDDMERDEMTGRTIVDWDD